MTYAPMKLCLKVAKLNASIRLGPFWKFDNKSKVYIAIPKAAT